MEVIAKTESCSFYNQKGTVYCSVSILEQRIIDPYNPKIEDFKKFKKGEQLSLKYRLEDPELLIQYLVEPVVRLTIYDTEENKDPRTKQVSLKYLFKNVQNATFFGDCN